MRYRIKSDEGMMVCWKFWDENKYVPGHSSPFLSHWLIVQICHETKMKFLQQNNQLHTYYH